MAQSRPPAALGVIGGESLDQSWKVIGAGGFGQVFKTRHVQWGWDVAVKVLGLDSGFSDTDLLGEAELMRRAESPYVIRVLGIFRGCRPSNNLISIGLVMELMERGSLDSLQNKLKDLPPWSLVFRLAHHVALGMNYLHSLTPPLIHRDLKPGNVLLDSGLNAKITDFGIAKFITNVTSSRLKGAGSPFFMPPEAFSPSYTSECSFDVYSFAVLLWSVLNTGHSVAAFDVQQGGRPPLDVVKGMNAPGLKEMIKLMERCWHQNPRRRPTFTECTAVTEGLYGKHQHGINAAVYQVQKKLDADGSPKDAPRDPYRYNMDYPSMGTCIIINNKNFHSNTGLKVRNGTDVDAAAAMKTFAGLGYKTKVACDQTVCQMQDLLYEISQEDHSHCASFVCVMLSHGSHEGEIYGTDNCVELKTLTEMFRGDRCRSLVGKPKLFFIDGGGALGARSEALDVLLDPGIETGSLSVQSEECRIPVEADFLYAHSTAPGYYSWRNTTHGSWFMQALCEMLQCHSKELELMHIMIRVNSNVALDFQSNSELPGFGGQKQIPCIVCMLTKQLYFPSP